MRAATGASKPVPGVVEAATELTGPAPVDFVPVIDSAFNLVCAGREGDGHSWVLNASTSLATPTSGPRCRRRTPHGQCRESGR
jgi:hypothetical protein